MPSNRAIAVLPQICLKSSSTVSVTVQILMYTIKKSTHEAQYQIQALYNTRYKPSHTQQLPDCYTVLQQLGSHLVCASSLWSSVTQRGPFSTLQKTWSCTCFESTCTMYTCCAINSCRVLQRVGGQPTAVPPISDQDTQQITGFECKL